MRKIIGIVLAIVLVCGVAACNQAELLWQSMVVYGAEEESSIELEGNIMAVFYRIADEQVFFWVMDALIIDNGDGTWDVESPVCSAGGVNQNLMAYGLYQYQEITINPDNPVYLSDLDLQPITVDDLPHSEHIGKLVAVDTSLAKPATVRRWYMGQTYDIQCLVEQGVVDLWFTDKLNVGDWVTVSFITEIPNTTERHIAVVTGKIYESW